MVRGTPSLYLSPGGGEIGKWCVVPTGGRTRVWGIVAVGGEFEVGELIWIQGRVIIQPGIQGIGVGLLPVGVCSEGVWVALNNSLEG